MLYIVKKYGQEPEARKSCPSPMEGEIEFLAEIDGTKMIEDLRWVVFRGEFVRPEDFVINGKIYTKGDIRKYRPKPPAKMVRDD